jgi:hypothetical protein
MNMAEQGGKEGPTDMTADEVPTNIGALQRLTAEQAEVQQVFARCRPQTIICIQPSCRRTLVVVGLT